jgi:hypothetical protein
VERVSINVSSYGRIDSLEKTIRSIYNQCDVINVALNDNHNSIPLFLYDTKINLFLTDNSLGDAFKFMNLMNTNEGYYLSIDDDLIYPPNYVEYMVGKSKEYGDKKVITLHGRNFSKFPVGSYYRSASERYNCLGKVKNDVKVQFGGTGVMCTHSSLLKIPLSYFKTANMADVWVGKHCIENNIEIICVKHDEGYIGYTRPTNTIYDDHSRNDRIQTLVTNSIYDKDISLDFTKTEVVEEKIDPINIEEKPIPIRSTIEKSVKTINYDKVNQIFNNTPSHRAVKPKTITGNSTLKTNTSMINKLVLNKKKR